VHRARGYETEPDGQGAQTQIVTQGRGRQTTNARWKEGQDETNPIPASGSTSEEALAEVESARAASPASAREAAHPVPEPRYRPAIYMRWVADYAQPAAGVGGG
jgi:hypothetical protein